MPARKIEVTVILRPNPDTENEAPLTDLLDSNGELAPAETENLTHTELAALYGASDADMARMLNWVKKHRLTLVSADQAARTVKVAGTPAKLERLLGVEFKPAVTDTGFNYRGVFGKVAPLNITDIVKAVVGLSSRPVAKPHFQWRKNESTGTFTPHSTAVSYTPNQVADIYNFPKDLDGTGQTIAIISLGGGYKLKEMQGYFKKIGIKAPRIIAVGVDGAKNKPEGSFDSADGENALDIEVTGSVAPGAKLVVYFGPNTDSGFYNAVSAAIHDKKNKPSIITISWGAAESMWSKTVMEAYNKLFQDAAALGITILVASGDNGSSDAVKNGKNNVDFPSSSPYVLACGGTLLATNRVNNGFELTKETVWNDGGGFSAGGGGVSTVFGVPDYQVKFGLTGTSRQTPDLAGNADPDSGYVVTVDGTTGSVGGTSAVAPLYAGLIARINQKLGSPCGYMHPLLYSNPEVFRDISEGNNGAFAAKQGWDNCTGMGVADGTKLLAKLSQPTS